MPSSFLSKLHSALVKRSWVSVAAMGSIHLGKDFGMEGMIQQRERVWSALSCRRFVLRARSTARRNKAPTSRRTPKLCRHQILKLLRFLAEPLKILRGAVENR